MVRVAIAIVVSVLMASTAHAKRVAFVVGINKYDNLPRERQLAKAVNDARAMEAALKAVGFDVIKAEDVGRSSFNQAWQQLLNKLAPGDEVAVFFSGHGVEIEGGNYLVPRDVPAVGTGEARRLKNKSLSFDEMRRDLAAQGPKLSLFILDACRDNPFADTRGRSIGGAKGLMPVQAEYGTFIMFAAGARESALDRLGDTDSDPNSIYTRKLLPLLKQPGLRLPDVAQRVRGEVRQLANTVGHRQSPDASNDASKGGFDALSMINTRKTCVSIVCAAIELNAILSISLRGSCVQIQISSMQTSASKLLE